MQEASLLRRLERLEQQNRRLRLGLLTAGPVLLLAAVTAPLTRATAGPGGPVEEVEAERFVLRGADGEEACVIGFDPKGFPQILMRKEKSHALVTLNGPGLLLRGKDGRRGAFMGIDPRGITSLSLTSERVLDGVKLTVKRDGSSGLYLLDQSGQDRMGFEASEAAGANIVLRGRKGGIRSSFGVDPNQVPSLLLYDEAGRRRAGMLVDDTGKPLIAIEDERGNPRLEITSHFDGSGLMRLRREDGRVIFEAP